MREYSFSPQGVCSSRFIFKVDEQGIIKDLQIIDGCAGNSLGLAALVVDRHLDEIIGKLEAIKCGSKNTSCPMQIAEALKRYKLKHESN